MRTLFYSLFILFLTSLQSYSTTYFVDSRAGSDFNIGTSAIKAFHSFSPIQNLKLLPGDSVLFRKGSHWNDPIFITANGTIDNPIIITTFGKGHPPGFDLQGKNSSGIFIYRSTNLILDGFNITNIGKDSCNIKILTSQNCIIRNCSLLVTGRAGIFLERNTSCIVQNNFITTPSDSIPNQTDGIYAQRNNANIYDGNTIIDKNQNPAEHSDCIQLFRENSAIVKNNYLEQDNEKKSNAQGLYSTIPSGVHLYYNNVIYAPNTKAHLMAFLALKEGTGRVKVFNNTLSGGFMNVFRTDTDNPVIKNNIFMTSCNCSMVRFDTTLSDSAEINNNLYYSNSNKPVYYLKEEFTFKKWQYFGYESEGIEADPQLNKDFSLKPGSPGINAGSDLSLVFKEDKTGLVRIKRNRFDLGAFEYRGKSN